MLGECTRTFFFPWALVCLRFIFIAEICATPTTNTKTLRIWGMETPHSCLLSGACSLAASAPAVTLSGACSLLLSLVLFSSSSFTSSPFLQQKKGGQFCSSVLS
jgi:hypothetical protein